VARKERLLQEVLERARKAETEAAELKSKLKVDTAAQKKAQRDMETALAEATAVSQRSEREYLTLRDSVESLTDGFRSDFERLRSEMKRREDALKHEASMASQKYQRLVEEIKAKEEARGEVAKLREEDKKLEAQIEEELRAEIQLLRVEVERSSGATDEAGKTATEITNELARLKRLLRAAGRDTSTEGGSPDLPAPT